MTDATAILSKLRRRRTTLRSNATRFVTQVNAFDESTPATDIKYCQYRLQEIVDTLKGLNDGIQDLLEDAEYETDAHTCEDYTDKCTRAIQKTMELLQATPSVDLHSTNSHLSTPLAPPHAYVDIKLPTIKIHSFTGDIETWPRFWEQFIGSIDENPMISPLNKHIFLRGYLDGEPKDLVDGIAVTADTYEQTKQILKAKYGDKNRIIQSHLDYLENLSPCASNSPEALNATYIECYKRVQALRALGENIDLYGRMLAPKLLRAFPEEICKHWLIHTKRQNIQEGDLTRLMEFLNEEVEGTIATNRIRANVVPEKTYVPTASAFHVKVKTKDQPQESDSFCVYCEKRGHWGQNCQQVTTSQARIDILRKINRCFLCLRHGHNKNQCFKRGKASCAKCKGDHHVSICNSQHTVVNKIGITTPNITYLQTICVNVKGPNGRHKVTRAILDTGSQSSFVNHSLINHLQLNVIETKSIDITTFEASSTLSNLRRKVHFEMIGHYTNAHVSITAFETHNNFAQQPTIPQDVQDLALMERIQLADPSENFKDLPIEILIGADYYWQIVTVEQPIKLTPTLVLLPTIFGYVLSGNRSSISVDRATVNLVHYDCKEVTDEYVRQFWDLETIGIRENQEQKLTTREKTVLEEFQESYQMENGRRIVRLPLKYNIYFSDNFNTAEARFLSLQKRLQKDERLKFTYYETMLKYIRNDQVELAPQKCDTGNIFYLPHHIVKKRNNESIKYRIVFDASSHDLDSPSLNDILEAGPNLLPDIFAILLRFRNFPKGIVCDVEQAFLQLTLSEEHRDLTRFLWYHIEQSQKGTYTTTDTTTTYRFKRLPFGLTSSPFLLSATIRESATLYKDVYPLASALVDKSTFMDDFIVSVYNDDEAIKIFHELTSLFNEVSLPLSKWATNSSNLKSLWKVNGLENKSTTRVLGIEWNTEEDFIYIDYRKIADNLADRPATKRDVLKSTAKFYDPLGLFTPIGIVAKLIFQETWIRGLTWEEILPTDLARSWHSWISKLPHLTTLRIPRWIGLININDHADIHVFCDASERAYGAVLYIRTLTEIGYSVRIVCSKTRLAPIKKVTLPRLELLGALVGSRLLRYFCQETGFDINKATLWSDSTVTLGWIQNDPNNWKTFICNRVTEILTYTAPSQWRHCPGNQNPADYLTRGIEADCLATLGIWWYGPPWLAKDRHSWPQDTTVLPKPMLERKARPYFNINLIDIIEPLFDISKISSYWRILHITAFVFRFVNITQKKIRYTDNISAVEIRNARMYWIKRVQEELFAKELSALSKGEKLPKSSRIARYNPFLSNGVIRLGGRLQYAALSDTEKHPIILDGRHHFTELLIKQTHIRLHHLGVRIVLAELREEFWIVRGRQTVRKVLHSCLPCKIIHSRRYEEVEAPLPLDRVRPLQPFAVTGIDFAGPLYIKFAQQVKGSYIVLFTCATTRAIHMELATNTSTDRFLMAMQRFAGRRSLPNVIYSDNATTFHAANTELSELFKTIQHTAVQHYCAHHGISWKFIPPRAAWWGGWWERMIGSVKRCLRKVLGRSQVDEEGMNTILIGLEAAINSRPITQGEDDTPLTPAHFLNGGKLVTIPYGPEPAVGHDLVKEFRRKQKFYEDLWKRWKREYLLLLRNYHEVKGYPSKRSPKIGEVVLLQEDIKPRHLWKRAVVEEIRPGRDDKIRCVILRQTDGTRICRPIQLAIPLEIGQGGEDVKD